MYLTDRKNDVRRQLSDHEELEILLETFSKQVEEVVNEAENIHVRGSFNLYWCTSPDARLSTRQMSNLPKR